LQNFKCQKGNFIIILKQKKNLYVKRLIKNVKNFLIMRTNKQNKNLHSLMDSNYAIWTGICGAGGAIIGMTVCGESKDLKELDLLR
jgi:hypothetical protein